MRQPREGEVLWRHVSGGRARHAITRESYPDAVCGVQPGQPWDWRVSYSWAEKHKHRECVRLASRGRVNFWPDDDDGVGEELWFGVGTASTGMATATKYPAAQDEAARHLRRVVAERSGCLGLRSRSL